MRKFKEEDIEIVVDEVLKKTKEILTGIQNKIVSLKSSIDFISIQSLGNDVEKDTDWCRNIINNTSLIIDKCLLNAQKEDKEKLLLLKKALNNEGLKLYYLYDEASKIIFCKLESLMKDPEELEKEISNATIKIDALAPLFNINDMNKAKTEKNLEALNRYITAKGLYSNKNKFYNNITIGSSFLASLPLAFMISNYTDILTTIKLSLAWITILSYHEIRMHLANNVKDEDDLERYNELQKDLDDYFNKNNELLYQKGLIEKEKAEFENALKLRNEYVLQKKFTQKKSHEMKEEYEGDKNVKNK